MVGADPLDPAQENQPSCRSTTTRLLEIERQLRDLLGKTHRVIQEDTRQFMEELEIREPVFVKDLVEDALSVIVNFGVPPARVLREIVRTSPVDGKVPGGGGPTTLGPYIMWRSKALSWRKRWAPRLSATYLPAPH